MSFLKINDPLKRDAIVKEYLDLKKKIRNNFLSERIGEQQLQTDLSKFYRPITETQKATTREITEGLKPIREGIEKLPEAIVFPTTQPLGKATEEEEEEEEEEKEKQVSSPETLGKIAYNYLHGEESYPRDKTFGIHLGKDGHYHMGAQKGADGIYRGNNKTITIAYNNIYVDGEKFTGTPGLWELIMENKPNPKNYTKEDENNYGNLLLKTNAMHQNFDPKNSYPRSSGSYKWQNILSLIWATKIYQGKGVVVIPNDPNALLERLDLLLASQEAGHTGVRNELVSICDELKRQGVLDTKTYKKLNSNIKKMIVAKRGFKKRYAYGGSGIFDTIASLLTRIFTSGAAKQIASSAMDVGKSVAKEGAKKALEVGKSVATDVGKKLVTKALTPKSKKILQKYTTTKPATQDINTLIDGSAIAVQELVRKLNSGAGIKKI